MPCDPAHKGNLDLGGLVKFAVRKRRAHHEWLIFQPGNRLDHWGPFTERAEFSTRKDADDAIWLEQAESFAEIVPIESNDPDPERSVPCPATN